MTTVNGLNGTIKTAIEELQARVDVDVVPSGKYLKDDGTYDTPAGGSGGHTIEDEGTPLTARTKLNFVGAGVTVTDDAGDDASVVTIPSSTTTPGGADTQVQFNDGGAFGGDSGMTYNKTTNTLTVEEIVNDAVEFSQIIGSFNYTQR